MGMSMKLRVLEHTSNRYLIQPSTLMSTGFNTRWGVTQLTHLLHGYKKVSKVW